MPQFFIDYDDGQEFHRDDVGSEVRAIEQAREQAVSLLASVAREKLPDGEHREFVATVRQPDGQVRYRARLTFHGEWLRID